MISKPTYEALEEQVADLKSQIKMMKQAEKELLSDYEMLKIACGALEEERPYYTSGPDDFAGLDDEDARFEAAAKNIQLLEEYEYYLSESSPLASALKSAVYDYPVLEGFFEKLLTHILGRMREDATEADVARLVADFTSRAAATADPA